MDRETALGLLNYASSYLDAAEHLIESICARKLQLSFQAPLELIVGHGVEITLKSYLRSKDYSNSQLMVLGHDLEGLVSECEKVGLHIDTSDAEAAHLRLLNEQFGKAPYPVRYLVTGAYEAHDDRTVVQWARKLERSIRPTIQATYQFE